MDKPSDTVSIGRIMIGTIITKIKGRFICGPWRFLSPYEKKYRC